MAKKVSGSCDCCGRTEWLSQCWVGELETWACDECRGIEPDDDEDDGSDWARDQYLDGALS